VNELRTGYIPMVTLTEDWIPDPGHTTWNSPFCLRMGIPASDPLSSLTVAQSSTGLEGSGESAVVLKYQPDS
jgi:hypothetical protein